MLIVYGKLQIKANYRDEFIARSIDSILNARLNIGCKEFFVSPDPIEVNRVNVFEAWNSKSELVRFRDIEPDDSLFELIEKAEINECEI